MLTERVLCEFINILVFRPFQLQQKEKKNSGYKHNSKVSHGIFNLNKQKQLLSLVFKAGVHAKAVLASITRPFCQYLGHAISKAKSVWRFCVNFWVIFQTFWERDIFFSKNRLN